MSDAAPYLVVEGVTKRFGAAVTAVDDVSFVLPAGRMLGLLGPSGCGKTTVLRVIAGLLPATRGTIRLAGADVTQLPPHRRDIGLVFQSYALFPHLTVAENVAFGLEMRRLDRRQVAERVDRALELVRLPGLGGRRPRELSGGQQQRVALARALVVQPKLLLLDEPLSNLDARLRDDLRREIREIQQRLAMTTVFVTHDQVEALTMCDEVGVMSAGRLVQRAAPMEIYERPATRFVAEFVGRINTLPCEVLEAGRVRIGSGVFRCDTGALAPGRAVATLRPHRIVLHGHTGSAAPDAGRNLAGARITGAIYIGDMVQYDVALDDVRIKAEAQLQPDLRTHRVGDAVSCEWAAADMLVFRD